MTRRRLLAAVRDRMRTRTVEASRTADRVVPDLPRPAARRPRPAPVDPRIEQLAAEAQYHRNRFELHRARVISASPGATTLGRLHELERAATAAEERLAHARRVP